MDDFVAVSDVSLANEPIVYVYLQWTLSEIATNNQSEHDSVQTRLMQERCISLPLIEKKTVHRCNILSLLFYY